MIAAFAAVWLGLAGGAAPVPADPLVPPLRLKGDLDHDAPPGLPLAPPWRGEGQPEPAAQDVGGEAAARFIEWNTADFVLRPPGGDGSLPGASAPAVAGAPLHGPRPHRSPPLALVLTLACTIPTAFVGPSIGHIYAGDWKHFWITGGARLADLTALVLLEKFAPGFGIGPLFAILNPEHLGRDFSGYPLGYPVDLVLVLFMVGSTIYDAVDAWRAAVRFNDRFDPPEPPPGPTSSPAAAAIPPRP